MYAVHDIYRFVGNAGDFMCVCVCVMLKVTDDALHNGEHVWRTYDVYARVYLSQLSNPNLQTTRTI